MIQKIYDCMIVQATKPYAKWLLGIISFLESSISPIPPDPLMIPMILVNRFLAWRLALITSISSVLGGAVGYMIGVFLFESLGYWVIETYGLEKAFEKLQLLFQSWGFWIIILKGLTPIPYKIVTITSGVTGLNFWIFMGASIISRSLRFYAEAALLWKYGETVQQQIEKNLTVFTFTFFALLLGGFAILKWVH